MGGGKTPWLKIWNVEILQERANEMLKNCILYGPRACKFNTFDKSKIFFLSKNDFEKEKEKIEIANKKRCFLSDGDKICQGSWIERGLMFVKRWLIISTSLGSSQTGTQLERLPRPLRSVWPTNGSL